MSITPTVLRNKRKNELKEIASDLGLNTKGLRSELEERIRIHLENSEEATSSKSPRRSIRKRSISSSKSKLRKDISSPPNGDRASSDEEPSVSSDSEGKQVIERTTILEETTQYITNQLTHESSQQDGADIASFNRGTNLEIPDEIIQQGFPNDDRLHRINVFLVQLRKNISNSRTFCKAVICLEFAVFLYNAIDWNYKIVSFPIPYNKSEETYNFDVHAPDISVLMEWQFWRPLISFIFYLLLLPLGCSYIFNFEPQRYLYSPLTFSVAQYAIFMISLSIPYFDWAEDVRYLVPEGVIYTGAGTGAIFALYESILEN